MLRSRLKINRYFFLLFISLFFLAVIVIKLFSIQVINNAYYMAKAEEGHLGYSEVNAERGDILIRDYNSKEVFRMATNISMSLLFADPTLIKDPAYLSDKLAPILFDKQLAQEKENERIRQLKRLLPPDPKKEDLAKIAPRTEEDFRKDFRSELFEKLSQKTRPAIILYKDPPKNILAFLQKQPVVGIEASPTAITAYPPRISDPDYAAKTLSTVIDIPYERLKDLLSGRNRYVVLRQKTPLEIEKQIRQLIADDKKLKTNLFTGVNFQEKTYRYYPEGQLGAQIIGFFGNNGGAYGIEKSFDTELRGEKGIFKTMLDATGQQVIVGNDLIIQPAIDGANVMLTIDRSVQMEIERILAKGVTAAKADSGLVIVMEPKTGRIISLANYPTFDPNNFGEALNTDDLFLSEEQKKNIVTVGNPGEETYYLVIDNDSHYRIQVFPEKLPDGRIVYSKYRNILGAGVYLNHAVADLYEPGSVFKSIAMSIALDDGDVTPQTTYNDTGPIKVDEYEIHNSTGSYYGVTNMREVLEKSLNTGMAFVARKMGRELFGRYLKKFGFGERTEVEFDDEPSGKIQNPNNWADSELITHAFGQGIAVTPIQLITAVSVLANKGILMKPHIIEQVENADGKITQYEPEQVRRVLSEKTAATISAMLVSVIENGGANRAKVPGYHMAGKTGTAQTYKHGKPLTGIGTTIVTFIGYGPVRNSRFVVLIKMDRPRSSIWADSTATPLFAEISQFLLKYYDIPPDT